MHWGSAKIATRGTVHQADDLPGIAAIYGGHPAGLLTYRIEGRVCEIISLNSLFEGVGVGSELMRQLNKIATGAKCERIRLITTNDNTPAMKFFVKRGYTKSAVHKDAVVESRKLKPEIPLIGINGVEIRDEIEFEFRL